jgi:hypothetical protein
MKLLHAIFALAGCFAIILIAQVSCPVWADGPRDNIPSKVRPIPPVGNELEPADRSSLQAGVDALGREIDALK